MRESEAKREVMSAQDRIAAMKARLAGIRASDVIDQEPVAKPRTNTSKQREPPKVGGTRSTTLGANRLVRYSEAPGKAKNGPPQQAVEDENDELYFDDGDDFDLPVQTSSSKKKPVAANRPPAPQVKPLQTVTPADEFGLEDDSDDVPEIDTRIRSTMALEKHWNEVEEKRKRDEALRKRKLKEKQAERINEEQRLLSELQEKKN